jgi:Domain of unknown function (DUF4158)
LQPIIRIGATQNPNRCDYLLSPHVGPSLFLPPSVRPQPVRKKRVLPAAQCIIRLFGSASGRGSSCSNLAARAAQLVRRDVTPTFILTELIRLLRQEKIVRPGYNTLQVFISEALAAERRHLSEILEHALGHNAQAALKEVLV